jgi:CheY-like chemotaxis protein
MASRILLADDSITIQKVVNLTFADEGIEVVAVSNGEVAERKLTEIDPDLVLADIFMPGKNGYELCEHIKQSPQFQNVPVVLLVGAFEPFDQNEARRVKADAHLTKPFESRNLVETVRKLIKDSGKPVTASLSHQQVEDTPVQAPPVPEMKPIVPPPVNIDFSAMSNNWPVTDTNTVMEATTDMGFGSLSHTSPLTIDLGNMAQSAQSFATDEQPSTEQKLENEFDDTLVMGSPFAAETTSNGAEVQDINISIGEPAEVPDTNAQVTTENDDLSADAASVEAAPVGVPSAFGHPMQEVIVDFDKSDEPHQSVPHNIVSLDADSVISSVDETGATVIATVEMEEGTKPADEQPAVEEHSAEEETIPMATVPESTGFEVTFDEDHIETASEKLSPETLLETDSPLGDVFDERGQNADFAEASYDSSSAPLSDAASDDALDLAPPVAWTEPATDSVSPHLSADYSGQSRFDAAAPSALYDSQPVAETNHSAVAVEEMPAAEPALETGSSFDVVMAATEGVAWQTTENEAALEPPSEAASEQWVSEPQFVAIDAETAKLDDHQAESAPVETGFEFKPVNEQLNMPESLTQTAEVESVATESTEPAAQGSTDLSSVSEALIEQIVRRVVEHMSSDVVREIAWEVVPDMVERAVREVAQDCASKKA